MLIALKQLPAHQHQCFSSVSIRLLSHMMLTVIWGTVYFSLSQYLAKTQSCPMNIIFILCLKILYKQLINFRPNKWIQSNGIHINPGCKVIFANIMLLLIFCGLQTKPHKKDVHHSTSLKQVASTVTGCKILKILIQFVTCRLQWTKLHLAYIGLSVNRIVPTGFATSVILGVGGCSLCVCTKL